MGHVVVEKLVADPIDIKGYWEFREKAAWCLDLHRASHLRSYLSPDRRRMICLFSAPDAEAIRTVYRQVEAPFDRIWPASIHEPSGPASRAVGTAARPDGAPEAQHVVVERSFEAPIEFAEVQALEDKAGWCLSLHRVRFVRTFFSTDRRRMICLYEAPDAESVRLAQRKAGLPFECAWAATLLIPPGYS